MRRWLSYAPLLLIVAASAAWYLHLTSRYGMLPGIDGPYYAIQVRSIAEGGGLKYPDPPLTFYAMYLAYLATGNVFMGVRLVVSAATALAAIPLYVLAERITGSRLAALASALVFLLSPHEFRLLGDFMKNSTGLLWLSTYLLLTHRYILSPGSSKRSMLAAGLLSFSLFMLAGLTHVLVYGFMTAYTLILIGLQLAVGGRRAFYEGLAGLAASLTVFYKFPWLQGGDLGKALGIASRIFSSLTGHAVAPLNAPAPPPPFQASQFLLLDWLAVSLLLLGSLILYRRGVRRGALLVAALGLTTLFFTLPVIPRQYLFRFQLMGGVPLAAALGLAVGLQSRPDSQIFLAVALVGLILVSGLPASAQVAPSIPPEAYSELHIIVEKASRLDPDACYLARNVRIKYWLETLASRVNEDPGLCRTLVAVDYASRMPPNARTLFVGRILAAWIR